MPATAAARDWARRHVDAGDLPQAVLGIASRDEVLALDAWGATDGHAATADDRYAIFSITKVLAGLTAMRAVERGLVSLEDPLAHAIPDAVTGTATLGQLLSHRAGLIDVPLDETRPLRECVRRAGTVFAPGTATQYSNLAFEGAAAIVEHATGRAWGDLVAETCAAAGMTSTSFDPTGARPVVGAGDAGLDVPAMVAARHPAAALHATAGDLLALGRAMLQGGGDVVHPRTLAAMRRPLTTGLPKLEPYPASRGQDWGVTWNLRHAAPGLIDRDCFGHGGWSGTEFWVMPGADRVVVLLTNRAPGGPAVDADRLLNAVVAAR